MGSGPSKGDKKITNALTNEGRYRPHVELAGQDCTASGFQAGNDPFCERKVWSQTSKRSPNYRCRRSSKTAVMYIRLGAIPGEGPSVFAA